MQYLKIKNKIQEDFLTKSIFISYLKKMEKIVKLVISNFQMLGFKKLNFFFVFTNILINYFINIIYQIIKYRIIASKNVTIILRDIQDLKYYTT